MTNIRLLLGAALLCTSSLASAASVCYGTVANGRIDEAVQLPEKGVNFQPYSNLGVSVGRTYVHSQVAAIVEQAYLEAAKAMPDVKLSGGLGPWPPPSCAGGGHQSPCVGSRGSGAAASA
jgi:penicillin-insensitive murein endopeptidase